MFKTKPSTNLLRIGRNGGGNNNRKKAGKREAPAADVRDAPASMNSVAKAERRSLIGEPSQRHGVHDPDNNGEKEAVSAYLARNGIAVERTMSDVGQLMEFCDRLIKGAMEARAEASGKARLLEIATTEIPTPGSSDEGGDRLHSNVLGAAGPSEASVQTTRVYWAGGPETATEQRPTERRPTMTTTTATATTSPPLLDDATARAIQKLRGFVDQQRADRQKFDDQLYALVRDIEQQIRRTRREQKAALRRLEDECEAAQDREDAAVRECEEKLRSQQLQHDAAVRCLKGEHASAASAETELLRQQCDELQAYLLRMKAEHDKDKKADAQRLQEKHAVALRQLVAQHADQLKSAAAEFARRMQEAARLHEQEREYLKSEMDRIIDAAQTGEQASLHQMREGAASDQQDIQAAGLPRELDEVADMDGAEASVPQQRLAEPPVPRKEVDGFNRCSEGDVFPPEPTPDSEPFLDSVSFPLADGAEATADASSSWARRLLRSRRLQSALK